MSWREGYLQKGAHLCSGRRGSIVDSQVLGNGGAIRTAVIFFYLSNEGISILENAAHIGLPIPEKLKSILEQLHDRDDKNGGDGS